MGTRDSKAKPAAKSPKPRPPKPTDPDEVTREIPAREGEGEDTFPNAKESSNEEARGSLLDRLRQRHAAMSRDQVDALLLDGRRMRAKDQ